MRNRNHKILLTGFGPFPDCPRNASADLVIDIASAAHAEFPDLELKTLILPTLWRGAPNDCFKALNEQRPDLVLHFGVAATARGFQIETVARNFACQMVDASGRLPALECLQVGGPDTLNVRLDADAIAGHLSKSGICSERSSDAGAYLCNAVLYHSLLFAQDHNRDMLAGFIHIPDALGKHPPDTTDGTGHKDSFANARPAVDCRLSWQEAVDGGVKIIAAYLKQISPG